MPRHRHRHRRNHLRAILALPCLLAAVACTTATTPSPSTSPGTTDTTTTQPAEPPPPGTYLTLVPNPPDNPATPPSADSQKISGSLQSTLNLQPAEIDCVTRRLDTDPDLRTALLRTDPQQSPRWRDLTDLAADCIRTTTSATNFANRIQAQANGTLTTDTLTCLRDGYANLSAADAAQLTRNALTPDSADPNVQNKYLDIFRTCGVDPARLPGAPK